jgi:thiosulfate dehydrogenase [quinone] large subunit
VRKVWALARIALGLIFLWAFVDKVFGLGFSTPPERSWLNGGSPTRGFLTNVGGPFAGVFNAVAGNVVIDWIFMLALLGVGVALVLGIGTRLAAVSGALLMLLMWAASLPLENHPFLDDHIVYALVLVGLALERAGQTWGLGRWWSTLPVVRRARWLE